MKKSRIITVVLILSILITVFISPAASTIKAEDEGPDPYFHIYLAFGQSNMDGNATPNVEAGDYDIPDGFLNMCTDDGHTEQTVGEWYPAKPPLARASAGLGICDYFGRKMLEYKQADNPDARVGIICVAVPGCATNMFNKDQYEEYKNSSADWLRNICNNQYGGNPYGRLVDCAKKAMEEGVIQGIIYHQGETDGNEGWADRMVVIYNQLIEDLGLEDRNIPFIVGECVPKLSGQNTNINKLKNKGDNFYVASSQGLSDRGDGLHFSPDSYRTYGARYADIMIRAEPQFTYSNPEYTWAADNTTVTAKRICNEFDSIVETETVYVTKTVVREASKDAPGLIEYTAEFTNSAFEKQVKREEVPYIAPTPTATPSPTPTATPSPTPTATPSPTSSATPSPTQEPSVGPDVTAAPNPTVNPEPSDSNMAIQTPAPAGNIIYNIYNTSQTPETESGDNQPIKKGMKFFVGNLQYKVTSVKNNQYEVSVIKVKNKKCKNITIDSVIKYRGNNYIISGIGKKFASGCTKLKKINLKSKYIKKIEKKAFAGIKSKYKILVVKPKLKKYDAMIKKAK